MEKPGQDNNKGFDNGVFSGTSDRRCENNIPHGSQEENRYESRSNYGSYHNKTVRPYVPPRVYPENKEPNRLESRTCCQQCLRNNKNNNTALAIVALVSIIVLLIAFLTTLFCLIGVVSRAARPEQNAPTAYIPQYGNAPYQQEPYQEETPDEGSGAKPEMTIPKKQESGGAGNTSKEYYGDITDAIRTDLRYSIEWENYEYEGNNDYVMIAVDYPVIKGDVPNKDVLNEVIEKEKVYFEEYYEEYSQYMLDGEIFAVYSEGSVTYMDEEIMSIVFTETVYTDYWQDTGLYCINIDMENGVVIDNSSIMDVNSEFAVDFRIRSREQNGSVSALDYMTDQEIVYYLSMAETSIIFYTPIGMEVGMNYGESYVTVTYKDYEQFLQKY